MKRELVSDGKFFYNMSRGATMKKIKYFIPSIMFMIIIFWFSHQTGTESSGLSIYIFNWLENHLHIIVPELIIRKMAHMGEYALLAFTFIYGFSKNKLILQKILLFSLSSTFLYACSDEFHQLFIAGRSGQLVDVMIDTMGGVIAIILFYFIKKKKCYSQE